MSRPAPLLAAGLLLAPALLLAPPPAHAQSDAADPALAEDAVALIPKTAGVVVRIADPDSAITHVQDFAKNSAPQLAGFVSQARVFLGVGVQNPTLSGIQMSDPWYLVMIPRADAKPATVYLLPVENAVAAEKAIGPNFEKKTLGTYLAYSEDADALETFGGSDNVTGSLPAGTTELASAADVTIFVNVPVLRETYSEQIEEGLAQVREQAAGQAASPEAAAQQEQFFDFMQGVLGETDGVTVGLSASAEQLTLKKIVQVESGSDAAGALAEQKPAKFDILGRLPEGLDGYLAFEGNLKPIVEAAGKFAAQGQPEDMKRPMEAFAEAGFKAMAGGFQLGGGDEPLLSGVQVSTVEDVEKAKDAAAEYLTQADGQTQNGLKTTVEQGETIDVAGLEMTTYSTSVEAADASPQAQQGAAFFGMVFGGSLDQKLGYTDDAVVQTLAGDDAWAEEVVGHATGSVDHANPALDAARTLVPARGNLFGAIDLAAVAQAGVAAAAESGQIPIPFDPAAVRAVDTEPAYAVFVVSAGERVLETTAVLPAASVRSIADLFTQLQGGAQGF